MKRILFIFMITLAYYCGYSQLNANVIRCEVYAYYDSSGHNAGLVSKKLRWLDSTDIKTLEVNNADMEHLSVVLKNARVKRLFGKMGGKHLYAKITLADESIMTVTISSNAIRDFTNNKDYWIRRNEDVAWMEEFRKRQLELIDREMK